MSTARFNWRADLAMRPSAERRLADQRSKLDMLRARYDHGAVSPSLYAIIRKLETDVAWQEHRQGRGRDA
jgi:hypothetical protein